jgi:SH3 domain protein
MKYFNLKLIYIIILIIFTSLLTAELSIGAKKNYYVSDVLVVTLRHGPGNEFKIIKTLKSDTRLEYLGEKDKYFQVRTKGKIEGWVLKQYTTTRKPKPLVISGLKKKFANAEKNISLLKEKKSSLEEELKEIRDRHDKLKKDYKKSFEHEKNILSRSKIQLKQITGKYKRLLERSENVLTITEDNKNLIKANTKLTADLKECLEENAGLKNSGMLQWFLAGAGVLFLGFVLGKIGSNRKKYYGGGLL